MRDSAIGRFYSSRQWRSVRQAVILNRNGLCERCLARGIISTGTDVHHKIRLTPQNLDDPAISLNMANLELLCNECHHAEHDGEKRYTIGADGEVIL